MLCKRILTCYLAVSILVHLNGAALGYKTIPWKRLNFKALCNSFLSLSFNLISCNPDGKRLLRLTRRTCISSFNFHNFTLSLSLYADIFICPNQWGFYVIFVLISSFFRLNISYRLLRIDYRIINLERKLTCILGWLSIFVGFLRWAALMYRVNQMCLKYLLNYLEAIGEPWPRILMLFHQD